MRNLSIKNMTRRPAPRFAYEKAANAVLPGWDVSLAFVTPAAARTLNRALRKKTYVPNVLSYEAGPQSGEIVICLAEAARQASSYGMDEKTFVPYLFIHGLLHLKGHPHGATMERRERELLARFAGTSARAFFSNVPSHRNRHRYRHLPGENRRRRRSR